MLKKANINFIYSVNRIMDFNRALCVALGQCLLFFFFKEWILSPKGFKVKFVSDSPEFTHR